jgi:hypothetical protein
MGPFGHICQSKATHSDYLLQSSYYNPIQSYYTTLFVSSYPITHPSIFVLHWIVQPSYLIVPCPTLDFSTILRLIVHYYPTFYPTSSYPIIHWIVHPSYLISPHPTTTFSVLPHHKSSLNLLRLTLDGSAILPCRTSHHNLLRPTLDHWIVQPSYLIVPYYTSYHILHWIVHPSYPILPQPCSAILPYRTLSCVAARLRSKILESRFSLSSSTPLSNVPIIKSFVTAT